MSQVAAFLLQAQSADQQVRAAAEAELIRREEGSYPLFVVELASLLADEQSPAQARQLAGILLKNSLSGRFGSFKEAASERWRVQVGPTERQRVHDLLIQALGSVQGGAAVRRQAAQALAQVAVVDLQTGDWPELIEQLVQPLTHPDTLEAFRHGCVEALGYICEEPLVAMVIAPQSNMILTALVQGMRGEALPEQPSSTPAASIAADRMPKESALVRRAATTALFNALAFVAQNMENELERDMILRTVMMAAAEPSDWELRRSAYECLVGIASQYYEKLACTSPSNQPMTYVEMAFQLTCHAIQYDEEQVAVQAIEFWSSVADEEINRLEEMNHLQNGTNGQAYLGIVEQAAPAMTPLLLQCFIRRDDGDDSDIESWNRVAAASTCVSLFAQIAPKATLEAAIPFVRDHLDAQRDWRFHEAALLTIGSIASTFGGATNNETLMEVFALPLRMLETAQHEAVRDTAAWSLGRLVAHVSTQLDGAAVETTFASLGRALTDSPRVARSACSALIPLITSQDESVGPPGRLSSVASSLALALWQTALRDDADEYNLLASANEAFISLIQSLAPDTARFVAQEYLPQAIRRLQASLQETEATSSSGSVDPSFLIEIQGLLCSLIQALVQRLEGSLLEGRAPQLMELILQVLGRSRSAAVHEDALMALGSVASSLDQAFAPYAPAVMPFVLAGMRNWEAYQVCAVATGTVSDICRALEHRFEPHAAETMQVLLESLSNERLNRVVKPPMIGCLGDIALALEGSFEPYLNATIAALQQAAWTTFQVPVLDDETNDWILEMRQNILDAYTGIINGLNVAAKAGLLIEHQQVEWIIRFCQQICQEVADDEDMLRAVVGVMGDIAQTFGPAAASAIRALDWLRPIVERLCTSAQRKSTRETANWAFEVLFGSMTGS
jgi:importin subunit beta-1